MLLRKSKAEKENLSFKVVVFSMQELVLVEQH